MFLGVPLFVYCSYHYSSGIISVVMKFFSTFGMENDYDHSSNLQKFILSVTTNLFTLLLYALYYSVQFQSSFGENLVYLLLNCWTINEGFLVNILQETHPSIIDQILILHVNLFSIGNHFIILQLVIDYVRTNQTIMVEHVKRRMTITSNSFVSFQSQLSHLYDLSNLSDDSM